MKPDTAYFEPAASLIEKCGGVAKTAEYAERHVKVVAGWRRAKDVHGNGNGGAIPTGAILTIMRNAAEDGLLLQAEDFIADPRTEAA